MVNSKFWLPTKLSGFIRMLDSDAFCACVDVVHAAILAYIEQVGNYLMKIFNEYKGVLKK